MRGDLGEHTAVYPAPPLSVADTPVDAGRLRLSTAGHLPPAPG